MKGPAEKPVMKRKKCDFKTKVITDKIYLEELKRLDIEAKRKKEQAEKRKEARLLKQKMNNKDEEEEELEEEDFDDDEEEELELLEETDEEIMEEDELAETDEEYLISFWKSLSPPVAEDDIIHKWYGAVYEHKKKFHLYVGKATRRFLYDEDGPVTAIELDCLKPRIGTGTILEAYDKARKDVDRFPLCNIIAGPLNIVPMRNNK